MKTISLVFFLFYFTVLEASVFDKKFPSSSDYQAIFFSKTKFYFDELLKKCVVNRNKDFYRLICPSDGNDDTLVNIRISRVTNNPSRTVREDVIYEINGKSFSYSLIKNNSEAISSDIDLITMNFELLDIKNSNYELMFQDFDYYVGHRWSETNDETLFKFWGIDFTFKIETLSGLFPIRRYTFFYENMPNPQNELIVEAFPVAEDLYNFKYTTRGEDQITPKEFYEGMKSIEPIYNDLGRALLEHIYQIGFPRLIP